MTGVVGRAESLSSIFFLGSLMMYSKCTGYHKNTGNGYFRALSKPKVEALEKRKLRPFHNTCSKEDKKMSVKVLYSLEFITLLCLNISTLKNQLTIAMLSLT